MVVEELYNLMEKKSDKYTHWNFTVYVEGNNKIDTLYGVKDLFKHEVISFHTSCDGINVKIHKFHGMKYIKRQSYKNENGIERFKDVIAIWK